MKRKRKRFYTQNYRAATSDCSYYKINITFRSHNNYHSYQSISLSGVRVHPSSPSQPPRLPHGALSCPPLPVRIRPPHIHPNENSPHIHNPRNHQVAPNRHKTSRPNRSHHRPHKYQVHKIPEEQCQAGYVFAGGPGLQQVATPYFVCHV
ncbi:hypothetical protein K504DRAFT_89875 [Pleomassaria siparia CBS 279.74]|uniref:Uncharacterized protein n=1 Tax=Pleomassaria siparia CBS 279.74 TaxID=1314801 RepID=A0A6G1JZL3_9PLEO|nr:hypothetical protein K504DRAFT_89875 [Pleomassaria siparia CBS 279.74]